ncbi:hypothetical protein PAPHI01_1622 [Pancytospora philotis]|nr:hypothetical protein PAPHI01_1622 [Pancytospora philotis]
MARYVHERDTLGRKLTSLVILLMLVCTAFWFILCDVSLALRILWLITMPMLLLSFIQLTLSDPGRMPKREFGDERAGGMLRLSDGTVVHTNSELLLRDVMMNVDGVDTMSRRFMCTCCRMFKTYRTAHCSFCDACVLEKDHHCFWLSNCVGRNNLRCFIIFLLSIGGMWCLTAHAFTMLFRRHHFSIYVGIGLYSMGCAIWLFFLYYMFLVSRGITSREYLSGCHHKGFIGLSRMVRACLTFRPPLTCTNAFVV